MQGRMRVEPRFWRIMLIVIVLGFAISLTLSQLRYSNAMAQVNALSHQRQSLKDQLVTLDNQLQYVQSDAYIERVARDELNMVRPGEIRYLARG